MLKAYLDTTDSIWLDEAGNEFRNGTPSLIVGGHEQIKVTLVKASPNRGTVAANPESWERDTSWAGDGNSAMLTIDNDYLNLIKLTFVGPPPIEGDVTVSVYASETQLKEISATGELYLYKADGSYDAVAYNDIYAADGTAMFTIPNRVIGNDYRYVAIPQMPLATAYLSTESDLSQGELVFDLVVNSKRLLELTAFSSIANVSISGIELLFYRTTAENNIEKIRAYMWDSVSLRNSQGNPGYQAEPPDPVKDMIAAAVAASGGSAVMEDVVIYENEDADYSFSVEGGHRYILDGEVVNCVYVYIENSSAESEIWFTSGSDGASFFFPETLGWIGEPSFEAGKSYIINIRNNCAVCAAYTPGATV